MQLRFESQLFAKYVPKNNQITYSSDRNQFQKCRSRNYVKDKKYLAKYSSKRCLFCQMQNSKIQAVYKMKI